MKDFDLLKRLNNFFLHNIRTQIAIIVSATELMDLDDEFKDSIKFSAFLLDAYDALFSILMDPMDGKFRSSDDEIDLKEEIEKLIIVFNSFSSNYTKFELSGKNTNVKICAHVFKNLITVLLAESIQEDKEHIEIKVLDKCIRFYCEKEISDILLDINKLMEKYGVSVYKKNNYLEVLVR